MEVSTQEEADDILDGRGVVLQPGMYAFSDGNGLGGVGVVIVRMRTRKPLSLKSFERLPVLSISSSAGPRSPASNPIAQSRKHSTAWAQTSRSSRARVFRHPRTGPRSRSDSRTNLAEDKHLHLKFKHQPGHRSNWCGRHDFARFNARAHELAMQASNTSVSSGS
jgi:hypothetical protein